MKKKANVYEIVTDRIIAELEKGTIPWKRPWSGLERPRNWKTGREYNGINLFLLPPGEYATYRQITEAGGHVKKGEKAYIAVFWKFMTIQEEYKDPVSGEMLEYKKEVPFLRYYSIFNIEMQAEGLKSKVLPIRDHDPIPECERIVTQYTQNNGPAIRYGGHAAFYDMIADTLTLPKPEMFKSAENYYATLFHEIVHSTGHPSRLKRNIGTAFGTEPYSREELIAEMGAAFLAAHVGIDNDTLNGNAAAYIAGWRKELANDPTAVVVAAGRARKAVDYILRMEQSNNADDTNDVNETADDPVAVA